MKVQGIQEKLGLSKNFQNATFTSLVLDCDWSFRKWLINRSDCTLITCEDEKMFSYMRGMGCSEFGKEQIFLNNLQLPFNDLSNIYNTFNRCRTNKDIVLICGIVSVNDPFPHALHHEVPAHEMVNLHHGSVSSCHLGLLTRSKADSIISFF